MIPAIPHPKIFATQIEIQNEVTSTKIKKSFSNNKSLTSVKIREIPKQDTKEHNPENVIEDTADTNVQEHEIEDVIIGDTADTNVQAHDIKNEISGDTIDRNVQKREIDNKVTNTKYIENGDMKVTKKIRDFSKRKKPGAYNRNYWVQVNAASGPAYYDPESRNPFIAKVFVIVLVMLIITSFVAIYVYNTKWLRDEVLESRSFLMVISCVGMLCVNICLCYPFLRQIPCNFFIFLLTIFFMTMLATVITVAYETHMVFYALLATIVTVILCMCLACTSFDFTKFWLVLFAISVAFTVVSVTISVVILALGVHYPMLTLVRLLIATLLSVIALIMELQAILGGKSVELGEHEYLTGAIFLYISIIDIFIKILLAMSTFEEE